MFLWDDAGDFKNGDTVVYFTHPSSPRGKIIDVSFMNDTVEIRWENPDMIPQTQSFPKSFFTASNFRKVYDSNNSFIKCTCGVDSVGEGKHSDYCDKYKP